MTVLVKDKTSARPPQAPRPRVHLNGGPTLAVFRRQLGGLLLNPLGYVYILAFVLASAAILFWSDSFYTRNIADLGPLVRAMPWLLVLLLPSVAMGSWASERELGTEEQLLTLPMTVADVLVGKWLGVVAYFTLALVFSLSNVLVLKWLGKPDMGLIFANYVGWFLAGCVCAALGILASTLVSLPAIAFVIGVIFCGAVMGGAWLVDWLDPFNRGLISLGRVLTAVFAVAMILGLAGMILSARRWHPSRRNEVLGWAVVFACLCITGVNLGALADRATFDWDVTAEKLSSLSPASKKVLAELPQPVKIVAFVSRTLPPELQLKAREVESTLKSIERTAPSGRVVVEVHHPTDPLDKEGSSATQDYGLTPKRVQINTVTGRQETEVFLAASISSGTRIQKIEHFDPGLSVEYELVRAVRSVSMPKKKVIGVASTDLHMLGGFDPSGGMGSMGNKWQIVSEWERQYEVREVNLDVNVGDDVSVLVVPQPSRLSAAQLHKLHDYIWAGRPALLLEDPMPMFSGTQLATSQPKRPNPMGGGEPPDDSSAEFRQLVSSLGLDFPPDKIVWSDYNPSRAFRRILPPGFVWAYRDQGSIADSPMMVGVDSLLLPFPGSLRQAADHGDLKVSPLVTPALKSSWGLNDFQEYVTFDPFSGGQRSTQPKRYTPEPGPPPAVAVQITGKMRRAFPFERKEPASTQPATKQAATAPSGVGDVSAKSIDVIVIADTDLAHDQFFEFYRNADERFNQDELRFLQDLRNVQFLSNAVDALAGDESFLGLRARRPMRRPLERLDAVLAGTQKQLREVESAAQKDAEDKIAKLRADIQARLDKIRDRKDLDEQGKTQLVAQVERSANRQLDKDIEEVNHQADLKTRRAEIDQQRQFQRVLNYDVRAKALGIPAIVLAGLALTVFAVRVRGEQLVIPESRRRHRP